MKRVLIAFIVIMICGVLFQTNSFAFILLTEDQALKKMFPDVDEVKNTNHVLTDAEITSIKERLGGVQCRRARNLGAQLGC